MDAFDFSRYVWRQDEKVPTRIIREVGGGELFVDILGLLKNGGLNVHLGLHTTISQPTEAPEFLRLLKKAWISLRWDVPTIASRVIHEPREGAALPAAYLTYDVPQSASEVESWADETVIFKEGYQDLNVLRFDVGQGCIPTKDLETQTFLYAVQFSNTEYGLLIRSSHVPFDGTGVKVLGTKLLDHLARYISDPSYASYESSRMQWGSGSESKNLLPIASEVLRSLEVDGPEALAKPRNSPENRDTLKNSLEGLAKGTSTIHPLGSIKDPLYDSTKQNQINRRVFHTFTVEVSRKTISTARNLPNKLTINQLLYGALCLLTVIDNPPTPNSTNNIYAFGIVNARKYLQQQYREPGGYPGFCLAVSALLVPVSIADKYTASGGLEANIKAALVDFSNVVKEEYEKQAAMPALLDIVNPQMEQVLLSPQPSPWNGAWFAGDGRGSEYLKPKYPESGSTVIEVNDFFVSVNFTEPGPCFRATEWNGRIKLSADYNAVPIEPSVAEGWMKKWAEIILAFIS